MHASDDEMSNDITGTARAAETLRRDEPVELLTGLALVAGTGVVILVTLLRVIVALVAPGRDQLRNLLAGPDPIEIEPAILRRP